MATPPTTPSPTATARRYVILDASRGFALLGICLANYGEFSLYTFLPDAVTAAMPSAATDRVARFFQYFLVDGKFYTIFSLLFGIGFSIILGNAAARGTDGLRVFRRRMAFLLLIGLCHLLLLWAGDILILYAFVGFFLPLFLRVSGRALLVTAAALLLLPVAMDCAVEAFGWNLSAPVIAATRYLHGQAGITEANFPVWLVESQSYADVLRFNLAGAFIRMQEFIDGHRAFKVLALFLLGLWIGRKRIFATLDAWRSPLRRVRLYGFVWGVPLSALYAWSAMSHQPWGLPAHSLLYALSVVPMALAYMATIALWYERHPSARVFALLAAPGRLALTNYVGQSVIGMIVFYGIGFALGATMGIAQVEVVALGVFLFQVVFSLLWTCGFRYGPLEWVWRMLIYGKWLTPRESKE
ncbi:MAG: DUF418 domain-containing protein [Mediterranea sp.]|jgi:uncharacterized protein|nr:DUF418 domain-containing protein [Mediterranea sp.]